MQMVPSISEDQALAQQYISPTSEPRAGILSREGTPSFSSPWRVKAPDHSIRSIDLKIKAVSVSKDTT